MKSSTAYKIIISSSIAVALSFSLLLLLSRREESDRYDNQDLFIGS